jgi:amino acid permease
VPLTLHSQGGKLKLRSHWLEGAPKPGFQGEGAGSSPFIGMFSLAGLGMAATVVNLVVLMSAMSW